MFVKKYFNNRVIFFESIKFKDKRGFFSEVYNLQHLKKINITEKFVQDNFSFSFKKGVVRGLHFQYPPADQSKLIRVVRGKIFDVVIDIRKKSKTYGKYITFIISRDNWRQLYIPIGFAHGFSTLQEKTEVEYKVSNYYSPKSEHSIKWDDDSLSINWKINKNTAILDEKDKNGIPFKDFNTPF